MTPNFDEYNRSNASHLGQGQGEDRTQLSSMALDAEKRDRFELLSAYLDGEVTADEKRQIEALLATDPAMQRLHARLLKLRHNFRSLPTPPVEQPVEQTVQQVFARLERRPQRALAWGGLAIAALFVGAVVGIMPRNDFLPSIAHAPQSEESVSSQGLMIALDRPVIEIPKAAIANPDPFTPDAGNRIQ
jgi:hypothetical protein